MSKAKKEESRKKVADIFSKSAMRVIDERKELVNEIDKYPESGEVIDRSKNITVDNIDMDIKPKTQKQKDQWSELKTAINGDMTERFMSVMDNLPDREFIRVYLKTIEYFKPKITRQISDNDTDKDTKIEIIVKDNEPEKKIKIA